MSLKAAERSAGLSLLILVAVSSLSACRRPAEGTPPRQARLTVSAAADLTFAFQELGRIFEEDTGIGLSLNFGSTGQLARQIEQGAPVDLFAAAGISEIEELERQGLILPGTKRLFARGRLVLWTAAESPLPVERINELRRPELRRIAIANPDHAPYGRAAREALQSAGLWEALQHKLVWAENVRQALQYAETGNVEVALVALSLCREGMGRWALVPESLHRPIDQALAVIRGTRHEPEARRFAEFITGPAGAKTMRAYGFLAPGEEPAP